MKKLILDLENCYGIKKMNSEIDFTGQNAVAIYAPNSSMKSSLAQTFMDLCNAIPSKDRFFPSRPTKRKITDENNLDIKKDMIFSFNPYNEEFKHSEKTSTLLVNSKLRKEYEKLYIDVEKEKETFLKSLKELSGSKKYLEKEISQTFTKSDNEFQKALFGIKDEVMTQEGTPFSDIAYDRIFNDKVLVFLGTKDVKKAIQEYITKYNELLQKSTYFKKGFNYYNASTVAKQLNDHGFFNAKHSVNLKADTTTVINSQAEFEKVIEDEKNTILQNIELKKRFDKVEKQISKNADLRDFSAYLSDNERIIPHLDNLDTFKEEIWKSYFKTKIDLYNNLIEKYQKVDKRRSEIEKEAKEERTLWEKAIEKFNDRFYVPFKLEAKNREAVILGKEPLLTLDFIFKDGDDKTSVSRDELMQGLSEGEKKAFYILNIIFEIEIRKKSGQQTVFIIDDIADSFDYKNKYAIIEYLKEISETQNFYQIILTHNFDFFRTIESRYIKYPQCFFAYKSSNEIKLIKAKGIKNIFVKDWKLNFFTNPKKRIASIPFIRNIIEYTKGEKDPNYLKLTSLLHYKSDTCSITEDRLATIFRETFNESGNLPDKDKRIIDVIYEEMGKCLNDVEGVNFENKIVLSIAIRLKAEKFMIDKINDPSSTSNIVENQTNTLFKIYKKNFGENNPDVRTIEQVILMTPENIHLNSFMYEPILDMSDKHLKKLCEDVCQLS
ncbi:hypothetical protein ES705_04386 [subsurface metagenome]|nr:phage infection protein [Clostridia bacterium]